MSTQVTSDLASITLPETILSPSDSIASADNANNHILGLKRDIAANLSLIQSTDDGRRFITDWNTFWSEWYPWYRELPRAGHFSAGGIVRAMTGSEVAQLRLFVGRFNALEARADDIGVSITDVGQPEGGDPFEVPTIVWVGLGVIGLGFAAWFAASASKVAAPWSSVAAERFRSSDAPTQMYGLRGARVRRGR